MLFHWFNRLGEDLAAAIVLRGPSAVTEGDLRRFVFTRLADFKVPSQILLLDDIPKGPTGKPQRIGLGDDERESADQAAGSTRAGLIVGANPSGRTELELNGFLHHFPGRDPEQGERRPGRPFRQAPDEAAHPSCCGHRVVLFTLG